MAAEDNFYVAIVLGSSQITAVAGRKQPDGAIKVSAYAQEPSDTFIRKGRINNVTKMQQCINNIKDKLEKKLNKSISQVYVGIGGMGMHTIANTVVRHFNDKTVISPELVASMLQENQSTATPERDIFEVVPQEFKIGTQNLIEPEGIPTENIEGRYLNIVANSSIREDLDTCFRAAGLKIAGTPISVLALSDVVLSEAEKRSGCVLVDMGAETTSVAVFKNNLLRHFAVIPLGAANINRDIASLQIEDSEAEELKLHLGSALYDNDLSDKAPVKLKDGRTVKFEEFAGLVSARVEEIILNIAHQIELSKYDKSQLIGGLVITGGLANMKNIEKAFEQHTNFEKMRFITKGINRIPISTTISNFNKDGVANAALAIIDKGTINCCGGELGNGNTLFGEKDFADNTNEGAAAASAATPGTEATATAAAGNGAEKPEETKSKEETETKPKKTSRFRKLFDRLSQLVSDEEDGKSQKDQED